MAFMAKISQIKITLKRKNSILAILNDFDSFHINNPGRNLPMDLFLRYYFLDHKKEFDADART
jgi:hypothetical protein